MHTTRDMLARWLGVETQMAHLGLRFGTDLKPSSRVETLSCLFTRMMGSRRAEPAWTRRGPWFHCFLRLGAATHLSRFSQILAVDPEADTPMDWTITC